MIDKRVSYDNSFAKHLKGLGLNEEDIKYILGETNRKKFEGGGDGGGGDGGGDGGGGDGGDSGDSGDSSGEGDSTGDANDDGGTAGPSDAGVGVGDTMGSSTAQDAAANQAASEAAAQAASDVATVGMQQDPAVESPATGVMSALSNIARTAYANVMNNPVASVVGMAFGPVAGMAARAIGMAVDAANRGVSAPNDFSQATESVQSGPATSPTGGDGIATLQTYAPLYNPDTGNPTMDAYMRRLRINLGLPV